MKILVLILAWDITDYLPRFAEDWKEGFFFARGFGLVVVSCLPYNFGIILLLLLYSRSILSEKSKEKNHFNSSCFTICWGIIYIYGAVGYLQNLCQKCKTFAQHELVVK